jgi:hypothetical protein
MRTCPINSSLFLSWLRLIWMVGEALDVGGGDSDRAASYQEQMSHWGSKTEVTLLPWQVRSTLGSRRRQTTRACPKSASNGSRQHECKGRRPAPLIEISLIEWMSGILSKVRISRTIKHLRDRGIAGSANHGNIASISCERGSFVTVICAPRKRAPDPRDRSGSCGSKR